MLNLAAASTNTTGTILELNPALASQSPVQTISIGATGSTRSRFSDTGTSSFLSTSNDGTQLVLAAYNTTDSATTDLATTGTNLTTGTDPDDRAVATFGNSESLTIQTHYVEPTSGDQTRSATTLDDSNYFITDKGGLFTNGSTTPSLSTNILDARSFGGTVYVSSTKGPAVSTVAADNATSLSALPLSQGASTPITAASWASGVATITVGSNTNFTVGSTVVISGITSGGPGTFDGTFTITGTSSSNKFTYAVASSPGTATVTGATATTNGDGSIQDFYLVQSGQNGSTYDVLYTLDSTGTINKFSLVSGSWVSNGSYTPTSAANPALHAGGLSLIAANDGMTATTGTGNGAFLYAVTTGTSSSPAAPADNTLEQLTDTAGYNATISISSTITTLYTATSGATLKGIAFTPAPSTAPSVSAATPSVGYNSASLGGTVTSTGSYVNGTTSTAQVNETVTAYGVVYAQTSVNSTPTLTNGAPTSPAAGPRSSTRSPSARAASSRTPNIPTPFMRPMEMAPPTPTAHSRPQVHPRQ